METSATRRIRRGPIPVKEGGSKFGGRSAAQLGCEVFYSVTTQASESECISSNEYRRPARRRRGEDPAECVENMGVNEVHGFAAAASIAYCATCLLSPGIKDSSFGSNLGNGVYKRRLTSPLSYPRCLLRSVGNRKH